MQPQIHRVLTRSLIVATCVAAAGLALFMEQGAAGAERRARPDFKQAQQSAAPAQPRVHTSVIGGAEGSIR